jgi:4-amino-4-deoxy-L-arabinose transferase-like glycosyltransferase
MQIKKLLSKNELKQQGQRVEFVLLSAYIIASTLLIIFSTSGGLIWTSDSFQYWAASRSFSNDGTFVAYDGGTYIFWPPLFPIILSLFNNYETYYLLHLFAFAGSAVLIYYFFRELSQQKVVSLTALAFYLASVFPYLMSSFFWTENIFTLLCYASLLYYVLSKRMKRKWLFFIISMFLASLMCLQRNAGIFILLGISIHEFLLFLKERSYFKELALKGLLIIVAVIPNILWNYQSILLQSAEQEMVSRSYAVDFFTNFVELSERLWGVFLPTHPIVSPNLYAAVFAILIVILCFNKRIRLAYTIMLIYILLLCLMPLVNPESMDRLIAPVTPIMFFICCSIIFNNIDIKKAVIRYVITGAVLLSFGYNIIRTSQNIMRWHERSEHHARDTKIFF